MILELGILFITITFLLIVLWRAFRHPPHNYPPGPRPLPIIGNNNLFWGSEPAHLLFTKLSNVYGDIFTLYYGSQRVIVLNDCNTLREAFALPAFSGRAQLEYIKKRCGGKMRGLIHTDGPKQVELKRMVLKTLGTLGMGKRSLESIIQEECKEMLGLIRPSAGQPFSTHYVFSAAVCNILASLVNGERYPLSDPRLQVIVGNVTSSIQSTKSSNIGASVAMPWMLKYFTRFSGWSKALDGFSSVVQAMDTCVRKRKEIYGKQEFNDFLNTYLEELKKCTRQDSVFHGDEGEKNLTLVLFDLYLAGGETVGSAMCWAFLLLAIHQAIQDKVFREIEAVIGNRFPELADREHMPYAQAFIMETQRYAAVTPLALYHRTMDDIEDFRGFYIPKNTLVIPNLYAAMRDPRQFDEPDMFNPDRFLGPEGGIINPSAYLPFSTGLRKCIGESLSRDESFLFVTSLVQAFLITNDPKVETPKLEYSAGIVSVLKPHYIVFNERQLV